MYHIFFGESHAFGIGLCLTGFPEVCSDGIPLNHVSAFTDTRDRLQAVGRHRVRASQEAVDFSEELEGASGFSEISFTLKWKGMK